MEGFTPVCSQNLRIFQAFMRFCRGLGVGADPGNQNIEQNFALFSYSGNDINHETIIELLNGLYTYIISKYFYIMDDTIAYHSMFSHH